MEKAVREILLKYLDVDFYIDNKSLSHELDVWDSLRHIQIVLEIEDKFGIEVPDEDLSLLDSFDSICLYVESKMQENP